MSKKQEVGKTGENLAASYLQSEGYTLLARNWRWLKAEIDIIVQKENEIIFVEVKARYNDEYGNPEDFVSVKQQKMIINAAHEYIIQNDVDLEARFDIIGVLMNQEGNLRHIEGAFYPF